MKVELEKSFPIPVTVDAAWAFLQNIEGVAGCVPGAKITEHAEDGRYLGTIVVRMGPANLSFKGEVKVLELNAERRTLRLIGKGSDTSGTSAASMDLTARIEAGTDASTSTLIGKSEVSMSGKAATFGGRVMNSVADQVLKQFAAKFAVEAGHVAASSRPSKNGASLRAQSKLASLRQSDGTAVSPNVNVGTAQHISVPTQRQHNGVPLHKNGPLLQNTESVTSRHTSVSAPRENGEILPAQVDIEVRDRKNDGTEQLAVSSRGASAAQTPEVATPNELNVLSLLWAIVRDWLRHVFKRKSV